MKDQWQPIETAPRDGTLLLLMRDEVFPFVGSYRNAARGEPDHDGLGWRARCCGRLDGPTHWMPLPNPPAPGKEERNE